LENESKWAVLTKGSTPTMVVIDHGTTILDVLEDFRKWKVNVHVRGFETCLKEYHIKLASSNSSPAMVTMECLTAGLVMWRRTNISLKCCHIYCFMK
jgi:hypothetical protein